MTMFKKMATAIATISMATAPAIVHAADASKLSVAQGARAGKSTDATEKAVGTGAIVGVLAAAAIIGGIIIAADGDDDDDASN